MVVGNFSNCLCYPDLLDADVPLDMLSTCPCTPLSKIDKAG